MSLKLPTFPDLGRTISAWAKELRGSGVVTVGRPQGPALPYLPEGTQKWEQRTPANFGEGWESFAPSRVAPSAATFTTITFTDFRWQILGNVLFAQTVIGLVPAIANGTITITVPTPLSTPQFNGSFGFNAFPAGYMTGGTAVGPILGSVQDSAPTALVLGYPTVLGGTTVQLYVSFFCEVADG